MTSEKIHPARGGRPVFARGRFRFQAPYRDRGGPSEDVLFAGTNASERRDSERVSPRSGPTDVADHGTTATRPHAIYRRTAISAGRFFASRRINVVAFGGGETRNPARYTYIAHERLRSPYNLSLLSRVLPPLPSSLRSFVRGPVDGFCWTLQSPILLYVLR